MKRSVFAFLLAVATLFAGHPARAIPSESGPTSPGRRGTVKTEWDGRTILYFTASWCGPCKKFKAGPLKKLRSVGWTSKHLREIDIDKNEALAKQYDIETVPTFVLIKNGVEVSRIKGYVDQWAIGRFYKGAKDKRPDASDDEPAAIPEIPYESVAKHAWRKAVVKLSTNCTGVCIDPSGVIATVLHCGTPKRVRVKINHETVYARRMYVHDDDADDCVVLFKIEGKRNDWPHVKIAKQSPVKGVTVYSLGYPGRYDSHFYQMNEGKVLGSTKYKKIRYTEVGIRCLGGNSGGPLLNSSGELVGLLCRSNSDNKPHYSLFLTHREITASIKRAWHKLKVPRKTGIRDTAKRVIKFPVKLGKRLIGDRDAPQKKSFVAAVTILFPIIQPLLRPAADLLIDILRKWILG